eukprot:scaffold177952_cov29-Attheya_sp.AAC.1
MRMCSKDTTVSVSRQTRSSSFHHHTRRGMSSTDNECWSSNNDDDDFLTAVKAGVEGKGEEWDDDNWSAFVGEVVLWLHEEGEKKKRVVAAAVGLIVYGATTEKKLQAVADNKEEFTRKLSAKGISDAICDTLFDKYMAGAGRPSSDHFGLQALFNQQALQTLGNDGISFAGHHLERRGIVGNVIDTAYKSKFVVVGSPPATGKTSLMQLVGVALEAKGEKVCYLRARPRGVAKLFLDLKNGT